MLQVNNALFVTGAPLLTGEMEGGGGMEHNCAVLIAPLQAPGWGLAQIHKRLLVESLLHPFQMYFHRVWELLNKNVSNKHTLIYSQLALCVSAVQE